MPTEVSSHDTIAAISTPPGRGGIGIVRLSGSEAVSIATQLVRLRGPLEHGRARLADVLDSDSEVESEIESEVEARIDGRIDESLVTYFAGPNSYTAEDLVEIAAHGSPIVLNILLRKALHLGARLAEPGEFTQRAFLSGRIDLTQAEAVRDLIEAQTLTQARLAASQMGGALSRRVTPAKHALLELIALLEAGIDFAEDDLAVAPETEILRRINEIIPPLQALEATFAHGRILHDGLTLAIVGRPNAGKSSLFNALVERERAIVTPIPGTTRDTVTERIALGGIPLELVDTAGLREATDEAERQGIVRSREALADAAIVLIVLDATQPLHEEDLRLFASVTGRPVLIARNKSDLIASTGEVAELAMGQAGIPVLTTSAVTGTGIAELREAILALATGGAASEPGMLTSLRHHKSITTALEGLQDAARAIAQSIPHEMVLLDLYRTLWVLDSLTGQTTPDDVLNLIFSTFCIGK
ncbi:tRNA uridine-5-carboxymethylaminomethyl(34) synthesis GTPase MnmE [Acidicapsa ligni]|uniref:tRNA uridine-5-carboxymethylaminomethyl(34) synthesis GTPase MnmE n=1 Tax=Acidicapsa ligni TaxID=542300 RepID=UPI0021E0A5B1|nr:tRNA uridine-5-carboxymethylaminomethyl(34) synthesis GTPase MnmE [Acidicapsa ligni]